MSMRPSSIAGVISVFLFTACVFAAEPEQMINIWPGKAPGDTAQLAPERVQISTPPAKKQKEIFNVSTPALHVFRPAKDKDTGVSVIILPGGGFGVLKMDYEGEDCATWLNTIGVTGIVLKYRVPQRPGAPSRYWPALQDAQRSISLVRSKAKELNLDPNRIGLLGFSAGAVVGAVAQAHFDQRTYEAVDEIDKVSCRPDFSVLIYPGVIVENGKLVNDIQVTKTSPPTFIAVANSDKTENSIAMYQALKQAGVSVEMHIYADGVHGFGMVPTTQPHGTWTSRLSDWMGNQGLLRRP